MVLLRWGWAVVAVRRVVMTEGRQDQEVVVDIMTTTGLVQEEVARGQVDLALDMVWEEVVVTGMEDPLHRKEVAIGIVEEEEEEVTDTEEEEETGTESAIAHAAVVLKGDTAMLDAGIRERTRSPYSSLFSSSSTIKSTALATQDHTRSASSSVMMLNNVLQENVVSGVSRTVVMLQTYQTGYHLLVEAILQHKRYKRISLVLQTKHTDSRVGGSRAKNVP